jgi:hypothetical protein
MHWTQLDAALRLFVCCHAGGFMKPLMLDLNFLPRDNGPPSNPDYEELRRQKFAKFEMQCSKVRTACSSGKCSSTAV